MNRVLFVISDAEATDVGGLADYLLSRIRTAMPESQCHKESVSAIGETITDTVVYLANPDFAPEVEHTRVLMHCKKQTDIRHVVVVSSAEVYGARPHNPGLIEESQSRTYGASNRIARAWADLENIFEKGMADYPDTKLTLLRPAACLYPNSRSYFSRFFKQHLVFTLAGHDPTMQLLHPDDLSQAIVCAIERSQGGIYNVAPDGVVPLRPALRIARTFRIPTPRWPQRLIRWLTPDSWIKSIDQTDYFRYNWTVSNEKIRQELAYRPEHSSADTVNRYKKGYGGEAATGGPEHPASEYDDLGLDKKYLNAYGRTLFKFLSDYYWRIECSGTEHIPREGRALLAGVHRGFMPLDGVMSMDLIVKETGRYPRFLIHPTLIKFPFQFNFMTKIGGIIACQQNADYVLSRDELVGFYPEGIQGAFRYYRDDVYKLGRFGRNEFVRMALRNRAPIVPFVTVGNAEIFPVFGKIKWNWWTRFSLWPCFPIAPPFPFLPIPLPSKWHVKFLEPVHVEQEYPPEAAEDRAIVRAISDEIREKMQDAIDDMLVRRKSIFYGSIFKG